MNRSIYTVVVNADRRSVKVYADLSEAIRHWDRQTFDQPGATGGISVVTRDGHDGQVIVREGWILRVTEDRTYLNPNLADTGV
jgi:hypothetical protein